MKAILVRCGINRNGIDAHFFAGSLNPQGDFTPVGNEYFLEQSLLV
jgi:hypothetical protein